MRGSFFLSVVMLMWTDYSASRFAWRGPYFLPEWFASKKVLTRRLLWLLLWLLLLWLLVLFDVWILCFGVGSLEILMLGSLRKCVGFIFDLFMSYMFGLSLLCHFVWMWGMSYKVWGEVRWDEVRCEMGWGLTSSGYDSPGMMCEVRWDVWRRVLVCRRQPAAHLTPHLTSPHT